MTELTPDDITSEGHALDMALGRWPEFPTVRSGMSLGHQPVLEPFLPIDQRRLYELSWWEPRFPDSFDHAALIVTACQVIERELKHHFADPLVDYKQPLLKAFTSRDRGKNLESLRGWLEGRLHLTMGLIGILAQALTERVRDRDERLLEWVEHHFDASLRDHLAQGHFDRLLDRIRTEFRNPAAHGTDEFPKPRYAMFCQLVFGAPSVTEWLRGVEFDSHRAPASGFLHRFQQARRSKNEPRSKPGGSTSPEPFQAIRKAPESEAFLSVEPFCDEVVTRALVSSPTEGFYVGDRVRLRLRFSPGMWVVVLCQTSSGAVVAYPNRVRAYAPLVGELLFPAPGTGELPILIAPPVGREVIFAIATRAPLRIDLVPASGSKARELTRDELDQIERSLQTLSSSDWAFHRCEFATKERTEEGD